jgi:hypothetical protein
MLAMYTLHALFSFLLLLLVIYSITTNLCSPYLFANSLCIWSCYDAIYQAEPQLNKLVEEKEDMFYNKRLWFDMCQYPYTCPCPYRCHSSNTFTYGSLSSPCSCLSPIFSLSVSVPMSYCVYVYEMILPRSFQQITFNTYFPHCQ